MKKSKEPKTPSADDPDDEAKEEVRLGMLAPVRHIETLQVDDSEEEQEDSQVHREATETKEDETMKPASFGVKAPPKGNVQVSA